MTKYVPQHHLEGSGEHWALHTVIVKKPVSREEAHTIAKKFTDKKYVTDKKTAYHFRHIPKTKFTEFRTKKINKQVSAVFGKLKPEHEHLSGSGIWDSIKNTFNTVKDKVIDFVKPRTDGFNNRSASTIRAHGSKPIQGMFLMRTPIKSFLNKVLNVISFGKWDELRNKYNYDKMFHLALVVQVGGRNVIVEKNEVVNVSTGYRQDADAEILPISVHSDITISQLLENTRKAVGDHQFFIYDAFGGKNCQNFIKDILQSNGLLTSVAQNWLFQPIEDLVKELPGYVAPVAKAVTDVAASIDKITGGAENKWGVQYDNAGNPIIEQAKSYDEWLDHYEQQFGKDSGSAKMMADRFYNWDKKRFDTFNKFKNDWESEGRPESFEKYYTSRQGMNARKQQSNERNKENERKKQEYEGWKAHEQKKKEWNDEMRRRKDSAFTPIVEGLTKVGDFAADFGSKIGMPSVVSEVYKQFAPPGSKYYKGGASDIFILQLARHNISPTAYLKEARACAKKHGYNPKMLSFALNNENKLKYKSPEGIKYFGKAGYNDFIIYKRITDKKYANMKRNVFHKSHGAMSKMYKLGKYSPNELSLNIIW